MVLEANLGRQIKVIPVHEIRKDSREASVMSGVRIREDVSDLVQREHSRHHTPLVRCFDIDDTSHRICVSADYTASRSLVRNNLNRDWLDSKVDRKGINIRFHILNGAYIWMPER